MQRFVRASAVGECCAIFSASSRARAISWSAGTTSPTSPSSFASWAPMRSEPPSSDMRSTASSGMRRASPTGSSPAISPTFTWVSKKVAFSEQTIRSLSAMKCRPPPTTMPFTAVMTGFQHSLWIAVR
jgi:hypothetical protein